MNRSGPPGPPGPWVAVVAWSLAMVAAVVQLAVSGHHHEAGLDLRPLYGAGRAVLAGRPIYDVAGFVYPPPAAVAAVVLVAFPLSVMIWVDLVAEILVLALLAVVIVAWLVPRRWRPAAAGIGTAALIWSHPAAHALWLGNISVLFAAVAVAVFRLFGTQRWWAGCLLLVASLAIKPLLLPLLLLPLLARRPRPLLGAAAAGAALLAVSAALTAGLGQIPHVVRLLANGSVLIGAKSVDNLSLAGFAAAEGLPPALADLGRVAVLGIAVAVCVVVGRRRPTLDVPGVACLGTCLYLALLLAGSLSEVHYVYAALPGGFAAWGLSHGRAVRGAVLVGAAATFYPIRHGAPYLHQDLLVLFEVAFFVATASAMLACGPPPRAPSPSPAADREVAARSGGRGRSGGSTQSSGGDTASTASPS